ncbi:MAG TPA: FKBP-type peptidyl-prolyl cis-trans isomerase [Rubricoccaceae bacterium]|jgi:FKBP-type peptidyl-prolyl cis-trans isomerase
MRPFAVLSAVLALAASPGALAQAPPSDADVAAYDAGYRAAADLREGSAAFTAARYREGFRAGLRADSAEIAYAIGLQTGFQVRADTISGVDPEAFLRGIEAGFAGSAPAYAPDVVERAAAAFRDTLQARVRRAQGLPDVPPASPARPTGASPDSAAAAAARFLAEVAARPGVERTASGLLYTVTESGSGERPTTSSRVQVEYVGRLADGSEFDRSPEGQPAEFGVRNVVPGFAEALLAMRPGERRTVWLPPNLAYGAAGAPGAVPPHAVLEFDLTLVRVLR